MRDRRWLTVAASAVAGLAVAAAGCGGSDRLSKEEYEEKMAGVGESIEKSFSGVEDPSSLGDFRRELATARDELNEKADELAEIEPPEDIEQPHDDIVKGMRGFADDIDEVIEAAEEGDPEQLEELGERMQQGDFKSLQTLERASEEIEEKGYDLE